MNLIVTVLVLVFVFVATSQNESSLSLESLCIMKPDGCHRTEELLPKKPDEMVGFYCFSGPDFKKVVNKLQSIQDDK